MTASKSEPVREEIVRQLEQFPVEVLEAALLILQARQSNSDDQPTP
jgi:hypothetical protein